MDRKPKRIMTEEEALRAEALFTDRSVTGATATGCPWCGGTLRFYDGGSGYAITCTTCDFRLTVRGI